MIYETGQRIIKMSYFEEILLMAKPEKTNMVDKKIVKRILKIPVTYANETT